MGSVKQVLELAAAGKRLSQPEVNTLLAAGISDLPDLYAAADRARRENLGDKVHLRAIIEFSNYCRKNCLYCGLRRENRSLIRYRLSEDEILQAAGKAAALGFKTVVLQSGEDPHYTTTAIARLVEKIKHNFDLAVTLSLGEHTRDDYRAWREAGADRYLLKHETSDPRLFEHLKPDTTLDKRLQCLYWLKELGYQTGAGNMVGLPGQSLDSLARDIVLMRDLHVEMAGIGPFLPHQDTPLKDAAAGSLQLTLKVLAVTRLCLPQTHLPATTALATLSKNGRKLALTCGANVIMLNVTPPAVRDKYLIYPQKADLVEDTEQALGETKAMLARLGRPVALDYGHAPKLTGGS